jgi:hypothetical protein
VYEPSVCPIVSAPNPRLDNASPVLRTAVVPDAVTVDVAPAAPTPPKILGFHVIDCVAVGEVDPLLAVKVNVVVVAKE